MLFLLTTVTVNILIKVSTKPFGSLSWLITFSPQTLSNEIRISLSPCPLQLLTLCHMCEFNACFRCLKRSFGSFTEAAFLLTIPNNLTLLENLATFLIAPTSKWFRNKLKSNDPNKNPRGGWRSIQLCSLQVLSIYSYSLHWALNLTLIHKMTLTSISLLSDLF